MNSPNLFRIKVLLIIFASLTLFTACVLSIVFGVQYKTQVMVKSNATRHHCTVTGYKMIQQDSYSYRNDDDVWITIPARCIVESIADCVDLYHVKNLGCATQFCNNTESIDTCITYTVAPTYNVYTFSKNLKDVYDEMEFNRLIKKYFYSDRIPSLTIWLIILVLCIALIISASYISVD